MFSLTLQDTVTRESKSDESAAKLAVSRSSEMVFSPAPLLDEKQAVEHTSTSIAIKTMSPLVDIACVWIEVSDYQYYSHIH